MMHYFRDVFWCRLCHLLRSWDSRFRDSDSARMRSRHTFLLEKIGQRDRTEIDRESIHTHFRAGWIEDRGQDAQQPEDGSKTSELQLGGKGARSHCS